MSQNLATLVGELIDQKPVASPFVESVINEPTSDNSGDSVSGGVDDLGSGNDATISTVRPAEIFDPTIHATDTATGLPKRNADGSLAKKRGRKSGSINKPSVAAPIDTTQAAVDLQYQNAAIMTVQTIVILGYSLGGKDEWQPEAAELFAMNEAWTAYYKAKGTTDLPPWLGVAIATGAYAAPRVQKPKTSEKLRALFGWLKPLPGKVRKWFGKRGS